MTDPSHDPSSEPAHDVLAAEEFELPAEDPALRRERAVSLPAEPYPAVEAHDVLAAEEFAVPAGRALVARGGGADGAAGDAGGSGSGRVGRAGAAVGVAAVAIVTVLWRRRR